MSVALADLRILPPAFEELRATAEGEGYLFLNRLAARWNGGAYDIDSQAAVIGAFENGALVAIGAHTYDEYDPHPDHRRIRHFYVLPTARRSGVGRALANTLTERALAPAPCLHLRATHDLSRAFWDSMGFERVDRPDRSHRKVRP